MICLMPQCGYLSETSRMIEVWRALHRRGTPVRMALHGGRHEQLITQAGIPYDQVGPRMSAERSLQLVRDSPGLGDVRQSVYTPDELRRYARAEAGYLREIGARAVVTGFTLTTLLSSRLAGIPLVTEHNGSWLPPVWERGLLPVPADPPWPWMSRLPERVARRLVNAAPARASWYCALINEAGAELGVEPVPSTAALTLGDVALLTEAPEVVGLPADAFTSWRPPVRRGPASARYRSGSRLAVAGPIYARLATPLPAEAEAALAAPGPRAYLAMTSTPPDLIRATLRAVLRAAPDLHVLVAGTVHDPARLAPDDVPRERVTVCGVLPSHLVMPWVDVAVTTAGQGSLQTAMAAGTPVVGVPLQPEQDLNIVLLARRGAGIRVPRSAAGTATMTAAVRRALHHPELRTAAAGIQALYRRIDGPAAAAAVIEEVAGVSR